MSICISTGLIRSNLRYVIGALVIEFTMYADQNHISNCIIIIIIIIIINIFFSFYRHRQIPFNIFLE